MTDDRRHFGPIPVLQFVEVSVDDPRSIELVGEVQPEVMALYEEHGYQPIPGFGPYRCAPGSRSFGRDL